MEYTSTTCHFAPVFPYRPELRRKRPQVPQPPRGFPPIESDWVVEFETFLSSDQKATLYSHLFRPVNLQGPRAHKALVVLHGQGEHSGRYIHWPHFLRDTVGSIYAIDHRGHGQSTGIRGHIDHFDVYASDACDAIRRYASYLRQQYGRAEVHLAAHSMGGLIALRALLNDPGLPVESVTLSAPMVELGFKVPKAKVMAGRMMLSLLPFLPLPGEPLADLVSRDPEVVKHYKGDSLNHGLASSGFYFSYLEAKDDMLQRAGELKKPLLLLLPDSDRVINPKATERFFKKIGSKDKKLIHFPSGFHEVFNEPEKEQAFSELRSWIDQHSDG